MHPRRGLRGLAWLVTGSLGCGAPHVSSDAEARADASVEDATSSGDAGTVDPDDAGPPLPEWLVAGATGTCGRRERTGYCWGTTWLPGAMSSPTEIPYLYRAESFALAEDNACLVTAEGLPACAGDNRAGQLAFAPDITDHRDDFIIVEELGSVRDVAVGGSSVCVITSAARVSCWGDDSVGQTGSPIPPHEEGSVAPQWQPAFVPGVISAIDVAMGEAHACALLVRGRVMCWGHDRYGALGRGAGYTGLPQPEPALVEGITDAVALAVDDQGGCVVRRSGEVACWGGSVVGYPGFDPASADECTVVDAQACWRGPRDISVPPAHAIVLGGGAGCVATDTGWECFGRNDHGALPGPDEPIDAEATLTMGDGHLCMRRPDGSVACRGRGEEGQLGDGRSTSTPRWTELRRP